MIGISRSSQWQKKKELFQNRVAVLTIQSRYLTSILVIHCNLFLELMNRNNYFVKVIFVRMPALAEYFKGKETLKRLVCRLRRRLHVNLRNIN